MFRCIPARHRALVRTPIAVALTLALASPFASAEPAPDPADAQSLEAVVVTAAGYEQKIVDAPASISVITPEDLAKRPYVTLLDAVRDLEGVDVGETRDKTGQGTISMRGMGSDYTLILINGKRQNNHGDIYPNNFGGNQFGHIPPLDSIERIEVIRGPASTLYGADAMGGVINIITRRNPERWHGSLTLSGTFETDDQFGDDRTADVYLSGPIVPDVLSVAVRGSRYRRDASNPVYEPVTDPAGGVHHRTLGFGGGGKTVDNTNKSGGITLEWTPSENQSVTLDFDTSKQEYDNSIKINDAGNNEYPVGTVDNINSIFVAGYACLGAVGSNATACAANGGTWGRRANPQVGYSATQAFTRENWSLAHEGRWNFGTSMVSLAHIKTDNEGRTLPFTVEEREHLLQMIDGIGPYEGMSLEERRALAESTFLPRPARKLESAQYTLDANLTIPLQDHTLVLGTQVIRGELTDGVFGMETGTPGAVQDHDMWSLFAEDTWSISEPFALTAGLRHDDHEVFGSHLSPRLYGVYTVNERWTIKGGVSTGFKTPKTTQLYDGITGFGGQGTTPLFGNPDLQPETSISNELAFYWQHPDGHNFNATAFRNTFDDKLSTENCAPNLSIACPTGVYADLGYVTGSVPVNIDKVVIQGVELAGRWEITDAFGFRANYTYTDSEQKSGAQIGRPLGNTARHMANATLEWKATDNFDVFLTTEARSKRYRGLSTSGEELYYKDYTVLHLGASYTINEHVRLNARINNLLDRDFTSYEAVFEDLNGDGVYTPSTGAGSVSEVNFNDDYNNKDKARNVWLSVNVSF